MTEREQETDGADAPDPPICAAAAPASVAALAHANGLSALMPPFAEPFISGQDVGLELASLMNAGDLQKGLSRLC